jgi:hypothetical protein
MKRKLNPDLVWDKRGLDRQFAFEEHWVVLRNPVVRGDSRAFGIGHMEIEEIQETPAERNSHGAQIRETELALSAHAGIEPAAEPHIILTKDCFGFNGPVRLFVYSVKPFA